MTQLASDSEMEGIDLIWITSQYVFDFRGDTCISLQIYFYKWYYSLKEQIR